MCKTCVPKKTSKTRSYEEALRIIKDLKDAEEKSLGPVNKWCVADALQATDGADSAGAQVDPGEPDKEMVSETIQMAADLTESVLHDHPKKKGACKHYLRKSCKHGRLGEGCAFDHPKLCSRFVNNGPNNRRGCRDGKKCIFFHPPLCHESVDKGECSRGQCRFFHLKGTKKVLQTSIQDGQRDSGADDKGRSFADAVADRPRRVIEETPAGSGPGSVIAGRTDSAANQDFLELTRQVQAIQRQLSELLTVGLGRVQPLQRSGVHNQCRCQVLQ
jgi:hypothetical protein